MGLVNNENKVIIDFKGVIVIILVIVAILSFLAFIYDFPGLGFFGFSFDGLVICIWLLLVGQRHPIVYILLVACVLVGLCAFATHVTPEWKRLTSSPNQAKQQQQGTHSISHLTPDTHTQAWYTPEVRGVRG